MRHESRKCRKKLKGLKFYFGFFLVIRVVLDLDIIRFIVSNVIELLCLLAFNEC